jgi:hypothetical protein
MPREATRRFVDLKVKEVSLVDSPANEQEFIVIKRLDQEEVDMAGNNQEATKAEQAPVKVEASEAAVAKTAEAGTTEKVTIEVTKANNDAMQKALEQVNALVASVASVAKAASAQPETAPVASSAVEKSAGEKAPVVAPQATPAPTTEAQVDKSKAFTPSRVESLKGVVDSLQKLLNEISPQESASSGTTGTTKSAASSDELAKTVTTLGETVTKAIIQMAEVNKSLTGRLEAIEKTREAPKSETEGGTETKTQKSMWSGIL